MLVFVGMCYSHGMLTRCYPLGRLFNGAIHGEGEPINTYYCARLVSTFLNTILLSLKRKLISQYTHTWALTYTNGMHARTHARTHASTRTHARTQTNFLCVGKPNCPDNLQRHWSEIKELTPVSRASWNRTQGLRVLFSHVTSWAKRHRIWIIRTLTQCD